MYKIRLPSRQPCIYKNQEFSSRLEARWACFFDLCGWEWQYKPFKAGRWEPEFRVSWVCGHSECDEHVLIIEVKPYDRIDDFDDNNYGMQFFYGCGWAEDGCSPMDTLEAHELPPCSSSAVFGNNPNITYWDMAHGHGGGIYSVDCFVHKSDELWERAGNLI